ncbi:MAG: cell division ATP-binding protein FtsE [Desulfovibrionales bacterium]
MLELTHVSHDFGTHWALKNLSFSLKQGDFLFLTGPSGAGKTTLLRVIHGDIPLKRGNAFVAGFDLRNMKPRQIPMLRRQVSVVFQDFKILPNLSVYANVALPLEVRGLARPRIERRVRAILRSLHLDNKSQTPCRELSGGEQQRVGIARAVVVNPKILLADEPTGNLDPYLSRKLLAIFRQFHRHGTTVVFATHSKELISTIPDAKILVLKNGMVAGANFESAEIGTSPHEDDAA